MGLDWIGKWEGIGGEGTVHASDMYPPGCTHVPCRTVTGGGWADVGQ